LQAQVSALGRQVEEERLQAKRQEIEAGKYIQIVKILEEELRGARDTIAR
jgi:hypothetical protein